jgi:predicted  nucleic acid-binding Zn-ribbon protein
MANNFYSAFREYSLIIQDWLRNLIDLPYLKAADFGILKITLIGTTIAKLAGGQELTSQTTGRNQHEVHLNTANHGIHAGDALRLYDTSHMEIGGKDLSNDGYYTVLAVKDHIIIIDQQFKKLTLEQEESEGRCRKTLIVIYAEMQQAVARIAAPLKNGLTQSPGISFSIVDHIRKEGGRPVENLYTRRYYDEMCKKLGTAKVPPLQEFQVAYQVTLWSPYRSYMSIMQYQIASEFTPDKFWWVPGWGEKDDRYGMDFTNNPLHDRSRREHHGQWAHAQLDSMNDASELEDAKAVQVFRTDVNFTIDNAFIPLPFDNTAGKIEGVKVDFKIHHEKDITIGVSNASNLTIYPPTDNEDHQIKIIKEGYAALQEIQERLKRMALEEEFATFKLKVSGIEVKLQDIQETLEDHSEENDEKLNTVKLQINSITSQLTPVKEMLESLNDEFNDTKTGYESRLLSLENILEQHLEDNGNSGNLSPEAVQNAIDNISAMSGKVTVLEGKMEDIENQIDLAIGKAVEDITAEIEVQVSTLISDLDDKINTVQGNVDAEVLARQTALESVQDDIYELKQSLIPKNISDYLKSKPKWAAIEPISNQENRLVIFVDGNIINMSRINKEQVEDITLDDLTGGLIEGATYKTFTWEEADLEPGKLIWTDTDNSSLTYSMLCIRIDNDIRMLVKSVSANEFGWTDNTKLSFEAID